jgi:hypothetical protein
MEKKTRVFCSIDVQEFNLWIQTSAVRKLFPEEGSKPPKITATCSTSTGIHLKIIIEE